jgi:hypothetical protein
LKEEKQEVWEELAQAHSHVEEHASSHDEKVSGEEDQAVVHDETVDTGMLMGFVTGTDDEGATSCPTYDDYEDDDTTTPCAPLALSDEVHDTDTYDKQVDGTYIEDAYDDEGVPTPIYDEHSTSHPTLDTYDDDDDEGTRIPTYDGGWMFERLLGDMGPSSQEPCVEDDVTHESHHSMVSPSASGDDDEESTLTDDGPDHMDGYRPLALRDLEDRLLVTEDQITQVLTRTDGARRFIEDLMWRAQIEERHCGVAGRVTSAQLHRKEALEQLKLDYLQLFMDRDLALKFVEDKDCEVEELHYQLSLVCSSPLPVETPSDLVASIQAGVSVTHDVREEPLVMSLNEEHSELSILEESYDSERVDCALSWQCGDHEPFLSESTLEAQR